ncbi:hypothetical protein BDZ89DRAFT_707532 [Hymenopellis radicata]|nr:hypothetical protein BDZ89DRAFT_707532 [Hymenopellis radicata]
MIHIYTILYHIPNTNCGILYRFQPCLILLFFAGFLQLVLTNLFVPGFPLLDNLPSFILLCIVLRESVYNAIFVIHSCGSNISLQRLQNTSCGEWFQRRLVVVDG